jgi:hypothetical protein
MLQDKDIKKIQELQADFTPSQGQRIKKSEKTVLSTIYPSGC